MPGKRRLEAQKKKKDRKALQMKAPGGQSVYARKVQGDYPPNSPYRTAWKEAAR